MKRKRLSRLLNHMTVRQLVEYAQVNNIDIKINDGVVEEVLLEIEKKEGGGQSG